MGYLGRLYTADVPLTQFSRGVGVRGGVCVCVWNVGIDQLGLLYLAHLWGIYKEAVE